MEQTGISLILPMTTAMPAKPDAPAADPTVDNAKGTQARELTPQPAAEDAQPRPKKGDFSKELDEKMAALDHGGHEKEEAAPADDSDKPKKDPDQAAALLAAMQAVAPAVPAQPQINPLQAVLAADAASTPAGDPAAPAVAQAQNVSQAVGAVAAIQATQAMAQTASVQNASAAATVAAAPNTAVPVTAAQPTTTAAGAATAGEAFAGGSPAISASSGAAVDVVAATPNTHAAAAPALAAAASAASTTESAQAVAAQAQSAAGASTSAAPSAATDGQASAAAAVSAAASAGGAQASAQDVGAAQPSGPQAQSQPGIATAVSRPAAVRAAGRSYQPAAVQASSLDVSADRVEAVSQSPQKHSNAGHAPDAFALPQAGIAASQNAPGGQAITVDAATLSDQPVSIGGQIAQAFSAASARAGDVVTIRLNPPELGSVRLTLHSDGNEVHGVLRVDDPRTMHDLRAETPSLVQRLADSGIQVRSIDIALNSRSAGGETSGFAAWQGSEGAWQQGQGGYGRDGESYVGEPSATGNLPDAPAAATAVVNDNAINVWI